jgi:hypothetical protein
MAPMEKAPPLCDLIRFDSFEERSSVSSSWGKLGTNSLLCRHTTVLYYRYLHIVHNAPGTRLAVGHSRLTRHSKGSEVAALRNVM